MAEGVFTREPNVGDKQSCLVAQALSHESCKLSLQQGSPGISEITRGRQGGFRILNPKVRSNFQIRASWPGLTQPMGTNYHIWKVILRHSDDALMLHTWLTRAFSFHLLFDLCPPSIRKIRTSKTQIGTRGQCMPGDTTHMWVSVHSFIPSKLLWLTYLLFSFLVDRFWCLFNFIFSPVFNQGFGQGWYPICEC